MSTTSLSKSSRSAAQTPTPNSTDLPQSVSISHLALVMVIAYIAAQMLADIASLKIGVVAGLAVDMGTFIYPVTFTLRDVIHKLMGKRTAQAVIVSAAGVNILMALYLMWAAGMAPDALWAKETIPGQDLNAAFSAILAPVWRIVLASIVAELVSELLDTEVYQWFVSKVTTRHQWARVLVSNAVSVPLDSAIFCMIAFYGQMPNEVVWQIFLVNMLVKTALTFLSIPLIYLGPKPTALSPLKNPHMTP